MVIWKTDEARLGDAMGTHHSRLAAIVSEIAADVSPATRLLLTAALDEICVESSGSESGDVLKRSAG
jgi:hypothetical protein